MFGKKKKSKILVAEDSDVQRGVLTAIVESRKNYEVIEANNGTDAMKLVYKTNPDVVILDVEMPGMNGLQICYRMKNDPKIGHIPVMIVTATSQNSKMSDEQLRERARADDFITKPFQSADILKRIDRLLADAPDPLHEEHGTRIRWRI